MTDPSSAAATWGRLAERYGAQERLEARALDAALRLAAPARSDRLVDLGTGTGLLLRRLAARPARPREATGVDRSTAMLARVGALPAGWSVRPGDARAVGLPDGWADVVTCCYLLHLLDASQRRAVLGEAHRLLGRGAGSRLVVVTVWSAALPARGVLALLARVSPVRLGGLRPLDPTADLQAAGFTVTRRVVLASGGYPSLVLAATPSLPAA